MTLAVAVFLIDRSGAGPRGACISQRLTSGDWLTHVPQTHLLDLPYPRFPRWRCFSRSATSQKPFRLSLSILRWIEPPLWIQPEISRQDFSGVQKDFPRRPRSSWMDRSNYVELEVGRSKAFRELLREGLYTPYTWRVRISRREKRTRFSFVSRRKAHLTGFLEKLREEAPGASSGSRGSAPDR